MRKIFYFVIVFSALFANTNVAAQEKDPLFEKDFVTDILKGSGEAYPNTPAPAIKEREKGEKSSENKDFSEIGPEDPTPTAEPTLLPEISISDVEGGIEISSIGAILSAKDSGHYSKSINQLIDVAIEANVKLDTIYSMGTIEEVFVPIAEQMKVDRSGRRYFEIADKIKLSEHLPEPYDKMVKRSPTWIVSTPQGKYILEGLEPLTKFVSKQGKLVRVDELAPIS